MATRKKKNDGKADQPSLVELLAKAGRFYANGMKAGLAFCETYVLACSLYGSEGRKAFEEKYAFHTDSMWRRVELVGKHALLPQFLCAPGSFVEGILRVKDSMAKQMQLVAMSREGKMEFVDTKGKIVLKSFEELSKAQEELVLFAMNSATSPSEIRKFAYDLRKEWRDTSKPRKPDWERVGDTLKINRAIKTLVRSDWEAMGRSMGWTA